LIEERKQGVAGSNPAVSTIATNANHLPSRRRPAAFPVWRMWNAIGTLRR